MTKPAPVSTDGAPAAIGAYSQGVTCGKWLFTSGQIGLTPDGGELVGGGVVPQARQALANLAAVLEAGGSRLDRVVKVTIFLADMADFAAVNEVYAEVFGASRPARSTVAVAGLPKGALVELDAVARRG